MWRTVAQSYHSFVFDVMGPDGNLALTSSDYDFLIDLINQVTTKIDFRQIQNN